MKILLEFLKDLKDLYSEKSSFEIHLTIFAMLGIMTLLFLTCLVALGILTLVPQSPIEDFGLWRSLVFMFGCLYLFFYFQGYLYRLSRNVIKEISSNLPQLDKKPFTVFLNMFPLILYWSSLYFILFYFDIAYVAKFSYILEIILFALILLTIPASSMILALYSKDFKYKLKYFSPSYLLTLAFKYIRDFTIIILIVVLLFLFVQMLLHILLLFPAKLIKSLEIALGFRLFAFCFMTYFTFIILSTYKIAVARLAKLV